MRVNSRLAPAERLPPPLGESAVRGTSFAVATFLPIATLFSHGSGEKTEATTSKSRLKHNKVCLPIIITALIPCPQPGVRDEEEHVRPVEPEIQAKSKTPTEPGRRWRRSLCLTVRRDESPAVWTLVPSVLFPPHSERGVARMWLMGQSLQGVY